MPQRSSGTNRPRLLAGSLIACIVIVGTAIPTGAVTTGDGSANGATAHSLTTWRPWGHNRPLPVGLPQS